MIERRCTRSVGTLCAVVVVFFSLTTVVVGADVVNHAAPRPQFDMSWTDIMSARQLQGRLLLGGDCVRLALQCDSKGDVYTIRDFEWWTAPLIFLTLQARDATVVVEQMHGPVTLQVGSFQDWRLIGDQTFVLMHWKSDAGGVIRLRTLDWGEQVDPAVNSDYMIASTMTAKDRKLLWDANDPLFLGENMVVWSNQYGEMWCAELKISAPYASIPISIGKGVRPQGVEFAGKKTLFFVDAPVDLRTTRRKASDLLPNETPERKQERLRDFIVPEAAAHSFWDRAYVIGNGDIILKRKVPGKLCFADLAAGGLLGILRAVPGSEQTIEFGVASSQREDIVVAFTQRQGEKYVIHAVRTTDAGMSWSDPILLYSDEAPVIAISAVCDISRVWVGIVIRRVGRDTTDTLRVGILPLDAFSKVAPPSSSLGDQVAPLRSVNSPQ